MLNVFQHYNDIEEVYEHDGNFLCGKLIPWLWFKSLLKFDKVYV